MCKEQRFVFSKVSWFIPKSDVAEKLYITDYIQKNEQMLLYHVKNRASGGFLFSIKDFLDEIDLNLFHLIKWKQFKFY